MKYVEAVDFETFWHFSGAEIELWALIQSRRESLLNQAAVIGDPSYPLHATHGDVRLDQFLLGTDGIVLVDWERYARGDPARDLGMLTGDVFSTLMYHGFSKSEPSEQILDDSTYASARVQDAGRRASEIIASIWAGYVDATSIAKSHLGEVQSRAGWNLAWHCIERVSSRAQFQMKLSGLDKALLGIALTAATQPAQTAQAFGIGPR